MHDRRSAELGTLDQQPVRTRQALVDRIWRRGGYSARVNLPIIAWRAGVIGWQPRLTIHIALSRRSC